MYNDAFCRRFNEVLTSVYQRYTVVNRPMQTTRALYSVSQKNPPRVFWKFFPNGWEFLINFLHTYYAIIYTLKYKFLLKCL